MRTRTCMRMGLFSSEHLPEEKSFPEVSCETPLSYPSSARWEMVFSSAMQDREEGAVEGGGVCEGSCWHSGAPESDCGTGPWRVDTTEVLHKGRVTIQSSNYRACTRHKVIPIH